MKLTNQSIRVAVIDPRHKDALRKFLAPLFEEVKAVSWSSEYSEDSWMCWDMDDKFVWCHYDAGSSKFPYKLLSRKLIQLPEGIDEGGEVLPPGDYSWEEFIQYIKNFTAEFARDSEQDYEDD